MLRSQSLGAAALSWARDWLLQYPQASKHDMAAACIHRASARRKTPKSAHAAQEGGSRIERRILKRQLQRRLYSLQRLIRGLQYFRR